MMHAWSCYGTSWHSIRQLIESVYNFLHVFFLLNVYSVPYDIIYDFGVYIFV